MITKTSSVESSLFQIYEYEYIYIHIYITNLNVELKGSYIAFQIFFTTLR